jgi:hypothetical protein
MQNENSVFTVTYPSLYLTGLDNISVLFLGMDESQLEKIHAVFEQSYYENEIVFYVTEKSLDDETIAWANLIAPTVNFLVVNTDNLNSVEATLAFAIEEYAKNPKVIYMSFNHAQNALSKLISHLGTPVIKTMEEFAELISYVSESDELSGGKDEE